MESKGFDTIYSVVFVFLGLAVLYFGITYYINTYVKETFVLPVQVAPSIQKANPIAIPRDVSPSGPSAPNARVDDNVAKKEDVYNVVPTDPNDEIHGSQDIKDNMRYPERMFGPGKQGVRDDIIVANRTGSTQTDQSVQPYAVDLVQNGAMFGDVSPNTTDSPSYYSSF